MDFEDTWCSSLNTPICVPKSHSEFEKPQADLDPPDYFSCFKKGDCQQYGKRVLSVGDACNNMIAKWIKGTSRKRLLCRIYVVKKSHVLQERTFLVAHMLLNPLRSIVLGMDSLREEDSPGECFRLRFSDSTGLYFATIYNFLSTLCIDQHSQTRLGLLQWRPIDWRSVVVTAVSDVKVMADASPLLVSELFSLVRCHNCDVVKVVGETKCNWSLVAREGTQKRRPGIRRLGLGARTKAIAKGKTQAKPKAAKARPKPKAMPAPVPAVPAVLRLEDVAPALPVDDPKVKLKLTLQMLLLRPWVKLDQRLLRSCISKHHLVFQAIPANQRVRTSLTSNLFSGQTIIRQWRAVPTRFTLMAGFCIHTHFNLHRQRQ